MRRHQRGFTLIELLVVIVIIGVVMGAVTFSINVSDEGRRLERAAEALSSDLRLARTVALANQQEIGLALTDEGYRFVVFSRAQRQWLPLLNEPGLKPVTLPALQLSWREPVATTQAPLPVGDLTPVAILLSSGEATPGFLDLRSREQPDRVGRTLSLSDLGDVSVVNPP